MKKLVLALAVLALATPALGQQQQRPTVGVGVSITPSLNVSSGGDAGALRTLELLMPINLPGFRVEPSLGILTVNRPSGETDESNVTLGVGIFAQRRLATNADLYYGGRLKLNFAHSDGPGGSHSGVDFLLAATLGAEFYLVPQLSLGAEAQLGLYNDSSASGDDSGIFTNGLGLVRFYF